MRYLLDTDVLSGIIRNPGGPAAERLVNAGSSNVGVSAIVAAEVHFGLAKRPSALIAHRVADFFSQIDVIPFAPPADRFYGDLRAALEKQGRPIGGNDLLIAAHALALERILVTSNHREFSRVDGLTIENWL